MAAALCVAAVLALVSHAPVAAAFGRTATRGPAAAPDGTAEYGVNTGVLFNSGKYSHADVDAQLALLAKTGATVVRSDALWEEAEQQPPIGPVHRYNWAQDDMIVGALASHGLRWLPIIDYAAPWAQAAPGQIHSPPSSAGDYAAYAAALASRYGPGGLFWLENPGLEPLPVLTYEIWNEPDNPVFWYPRPNPAAYAALYSAARSAIVSQQGGAQVIVGGLTQPSSFLAAMLASDPGLRTQIDGVAIHPYGAPDQVLVGVRDARLAMRADGLGGVPLYVTEFGWTTHGTRVRDSSTEAERPGYISSTIAGLSHTDCGIAAVLLYAWATPEQNLGNPQDWYGISPTGAGGSPDTAAFAAALAAAAAPAAPTLLCSPAETLTRVRALVVGPKSRSAGRPRVTGAQRARRSRRARTRTCRRRAGRTRCRAARGRR